jgi:hypothetical protein
VCQDGDEERWFREHGLSEPVDVTEALATPVCNPVWRDGADCLSCRWDEVIPSGICVRKNPISEGWQKLEREKGDWTDFPEKWGFAVIWKQIAASPSLASSASCR